MKIKLEFNNDQIKNDFSDIDFRQIIVATIQNSEVVLSEEKIIEISLANLSEKKMQELNKKYRKKDQPTDVLSFAEFESQKKLENCLETELFLGELIICYDDIEKYCRKNQLDIRSEIVEVVSHGTLHLLGFGHGEKMFSVQKKVRNIFSQKI